LYPEIATLSTQIDFSLTSIGFFALIALNFHNVSGFDVMSASGYRYLQELARFPSGTFEYHFSKVATGLELSATTDEGELDRLYAAALSARLCYIALNGLGGCKGQIKPELERHRISLEQEFMRRRKVALDCAGWKKLAVSVRREAERIFLNVRVNECNLAQEF